MNCCQGSDQLALSEASSSANIGGAADALDYKRATISIFGDLIAFDTLLSIFNGERTGQVIVVRRRMRTCVRSPD
jgi:hypothetical protein